MKHINIKYTKNTITKHVIYTLFLIGLTLLSSCNSKKEKEGVPTITVTIAPLEYLVSEITGPDYHIETFVPDGSSPETYEPSPQQMIALNKSDLYFSVGYLGFERTWLERLQQNAPNTDFINCSENIRLIEGSCSHAHHGNDGLDGHDKNDEPGKHSDRHNLEQYGAHDKHNTHNGIDPHIWTTPRNMKIIAQNITQALCSQYPNDKELFQKNLKTLEDSLEQTDREIRSILAPIKQRSFLVYHPTLSYFAEEYQLKQYALEEDGKSPSPSHLKELISVCRKENIRNIFIQKEFDIRNAETLAKETGSKITEINPLSADWKGEMIKIAKQLGSGFQADEP